MADQVKALAIQSWTLYAVALLFIAARIASRRILFGSYKKLQLDDYIMLFVVITYTGVVVSLNQVSANLSNYLAPGVYETLNPDEVQNAVYGSKFVFILEEFKLTTVWLIKACLLLLYNHMTLGLPKQHRLVKYLGVYCAVGYIVVQVLFLGVWCKPITRYWQVPVEHTQCASYYHHLITDAVFNISSDLMMLALPLPLLIKAQLPLKRKLVLCGVFSLGVFVILSAVLNRYYNFTAGYGSLIYLNWYAGETATAVIVGNAPHCWPVLSRIFRLGSFKSIGDAQSGNKFVLSSASNSRRRPSNMDMNGYLRSESEERLANKGAMAGLGTRNTQGHETTMELGEVEKGKYTTAVAGGHEEDCRDQPRKTRFEGDKDRIIKTVQLHQYSS